MKENVDLLIYNIKEIVTPEPPYPKKENSIKNVLILNDYSIAIKNGRFYDISSNEKIRDLYESNQEIDLKNENIVLPGFVEPHTHLVFGGSREDEFLLRLQGVSYLEIQKKGGGIRKTKKDTFLIPKEKLIDESKKRLDIGMNYGITTFEIKSGYGLELDKEIYLLEIINKLKEQSKVKIVPTFLLHLLPENEDLNFFLNKLFNLLPLIKEKNLTDNIDIFIEKGAFDIEIGDKILNKVKNLNFNIFLHIDQFSDINGANLAIKYNVNSVSHIDLTKEEKLYEFGYKNIVGIIFPLERLIFSKERERGREIIDAGIPLSISTDFNPGTSPSLNFPLIISLSVIREGLTVEEAINASTINSAYALNLHNEIGSIEKGKRADLIIFELDSYKKIPYFVGMNFIKYVIINGEVNRIV
ncbi:MAG: imidazolonepropionase [Caldisericia bacterium]